MIRELWSSFPRLMEQRINGLLDEAFPNPAKAFQLYKACQRENLWSGSFEGFSKHLEEFFSLPRQKRRKSALDKLMDRPLDRSLFESFHLNFRNAVVNGRSVGNLVSWAHNVIRCGAKTESVVISTDVLGRTLDLLIHPPPFEKDSDIRFEDFCAAWKKTVFRLFGRKHDADLDGLLAELRQMQARLEEPAVDGATFHPGIYLTQTEIDWVESVSRTVLNNEVAPKFPLSRGPEKPRLMDLEKAVRLYTIVQNTRLPELLQHRENIRATILSQCQSLLREKAA